MSATPTEEPLAERNTVFLIVIGTLALLSIVIAGFVIFSDSGESARKPETAAPVSAGQLSLTVGKPGGTKAASVVVYEDFGNPDSRAFEIASRDFLRIEAARGIVYVEYRPVVEGTDTYSSSALGAWAAVLAAATPKEALTFHDALFDHQPAAGDDTTPDFAGWAKQRGLTEKKVQDAIASPDGQAASQAAAVATKAGARALPTVLLDGQPLTATTPAALADKLQRALLARDPNG